MGTDLHQGTLLKGERAGGVRNVGAQILGKIRVFVVIQPDESAHAPAGGSLLSLRAGEGRGRKRRDVRWGPDGEERAAQSFA